MRGSDDKGYSVLVLAVAGMLLLPLAAQADNSGALSSDQSAAEPEQLEMIVVTATKRSSDIQTTPMSITAVTSADIASRGVTDFETLARSVPGLAMRSSGSEGQTEFEMRGLSSQGGNSSAVGFYLGEIPLASPAFSNLGKTVINPDLYDLSRVEVLRGPQGTLYGSSSMGGTVRLIPNRPQLNTFAASGEETFSDTVSGGGINNRVNGMLNLPLGQSAAVRIVGSFTRDSGWLNRLVIAPGAVSVDVGSYPTVSRPSNFYSAPVQENLSGVNTTTVDSMRAELLWQPIEGLTIEPLAMYQLARQGAPDVVDVNGAPTHPQTPSVKGHWEPFDTPEPQEDRFSFGSLQIVYQLPAFSVTSATGVWHRTALIAQDGTEEVAAVFGIPAYYAAAGGLGPLGPEPNGPGATEQDWERQLTEEFRVTSSGSGPLQWMVGYFYQDLHSEFDQYLINPEGAPIIGSPPYQFIAFQPQVIIQNAFFGHVSWRFNPHFNVEAGVRHYHYSLNGLTDEYGIFTPNAIYGNAVPTFGAFPQEASGTLPSFTATYNINDDDMTYFHFAKGFRLGGGNVPFPVAAPGTSANPEPVAAECGLQAKLLLSTSCNPNILLQGPAQFRSDTVYSYELGAKASFFERQMIVDVAGYYESWHDPQLPTNIAGFSLAGNGADARILGVEGQVRSLLPLGFELSLNAGYTHGWFLEDSALVGFPKGTDVPDMPKLSASAVLSWKHALRDGQALFGSLEEDYVGARTDIPLGETITLQNIDQYLVHLSGYSVVNFRVGMNGKGNGQSKWTAALFVNNLTNNQALLDPQPQTVIQLSAYTRYSILRPLTAGVDLTYQF